MSHKLLQDLYVTDPSAALLETGQHPSKQSKNIPTKINNSRGQGKITQVQCNN